MTSRHPILVVDDNDAIRDSLTELLELEGLDVFGEAVNGVEALAKLDVADPMGLSCVILLDVNMPVMDGYEFLQQLKLRRAGVGHRVVVISASSEARKLVQGAGVPLVAILGKPVETEPLLKVVRRCCDPSDFNRPKGQIPNIG